MNRAFKFCPLCKYCLRKTGIDGRKRLVCRKCGWIDYRNPLPVAICVVKDRKDKILIARRSLKPGINKWALPGGFVESGEYPETACLRELEEETGLKGKVKRLIGVCIQKSRYYGSLLVVGYEVSVSDYNLLLNSELKEVKFFSEKNFPVIPFSSHRKMLKKVFKDTQ